MAVADESDVRRAWKLGGGGDTGGVAGGQYSRQSGTYTRPVSAQRKHLLRATLGAKGKLVTRAVEVELTSGRV